MRTHFFGEDVFFAHTGRDNFFARSGRRRNPNIEMPTDNEPIPVPANEEHEPPPDALPYHRGRPKDEPDPPPIREPDRNEQRRAA